MLDKNSKKPMYLQLKEHMIHRIQSGELETGSILPTEYELCSEFGISRYPVRQAMDELAQAGYIIRVRGRGTFVSRYLPGKEATAGRKLLGLVMAALTGGLCGQILKGFEKQARERGFHTIVCCSEGDPGSELLSIGRLVEIGVAGIIIFPCDESRLCDDIARLKQYGTYFGLLDRNAGLPEVDYTGSDNAGGAYMAVRHLALQGYRNVAFVSDRSNASSVNERLEGYIKAVSDFELKSITHISINDDLGKYSYTAHRFFPEKLKEELLELRSIFPIGIVSANDTIALRCMKIIQAEGMAVGKDVGIIGFDNEKECEFASVPLTSVAQNGLLIGRTAADTAIDKLEGKTGAVFHVNVPTQLVVRKSCGE